MPPAPRGASMTYEPRRVPALKGMGSGSYRESRPCGVKTSGAHCRRSAAARGRESLATKGQLGPDPVARREHSRFVQRVCFADVRDGVTSPPWRLDLHRTAHKPRGGGPALRAENALPASALTMPAAARALRAPAPNRLGSEAIRMLAAKRRRRGPARLRRIFRPSRSALAESRRGSDVTPTRRPANRACLTWRRSGEFPCAVCVVRRAKVVRFRSGCTNRECSRRVPPVHRPQPDGCSAASCYHVRTPVIT